MNEIITRLTTRQVEIAKQARLNGEWDNPELQKAGPMSEDLPFDLARIDSMRVEPAQRSYYNTGSCPACKNAHTHGHVIHRDAFEQRTKVGCENCGAEWEEVFSFKRLRKFKPGGERSPVSEHGRNSHVLPWVNIRDYLFNSGQDCVYCREPYIEASFEEGHGTRLFQRVECPDCESGWMDVHHLVGIRNFTPGDATSAPELSELEIEDYFASQAQKCPRCKSSEICASRASVSYSSAYQSVLCHNCQSWWVDDYALCEVADFEYGTAYAD